MYVVCACARALCARACTHARDTHSVSSLWSLWAVVSSGSLCVGNELPCARINTVVGTVSHTYRISGK